MLPVFCFFPCLSLPWWMLMVIHMPRFALWLRFRPIAKKPLTSAWSWTTEEHTFFNFIRSLAWQRRRSDIIRMLSWISSESRHFYLGEASRSQKIASGCDECRHDWTWNRSPGGPRWSVVCRDCGLIYSLCSDLFPRRMRELHRRTT